MKKKILLSAFAFISIMAANKTFAQHYTYNNKSYYTNQQEVRSDIRDIRHDQANINYDQKRIAEKKVEMQRDLARFNFNAYRQDALELQRLQRDLISDRNELVIDSRDVRQDYRTASRF